MLPAVRSYTKELIPGPVLFLWCVCVRVVRPSLLGVQKGEKEEKAWGKNVLSQLLKSWGRKTLMDEEKGDK